MVGGPVSVVVNHLINHSAYRTFQNQLFFSAVKCILSKGPALVRESEQCALWDRTFGCTFWAVTWMYFFGCHLDVPFGLSLGCIFHLDAFFWDPLGMGSGAIVGKWKWCQCGEMEVVPLWGNGSGASVGKKGLGLVLSPVPSGSAFLKCAAMRPFLTPPKSGFGKPEKFYSPVQN